MKRTLAIISLLTTFTINQVFSQSIRKNKNSLDSLKKMLLVKSLKRDTVSIIQIHQALSITYKNNNDIINAHKHSRIAYQNLSSNIKKTGLGVDVIQTYAYYLSSSNNLDYALKLLKEAIQSIKIEAPLKKFWIYNEIAKVYIKKKEPEKALEFYTKSLIEASKMKDNIWIASANNNIGLFFEKLNNDLVALYYFKKSKSLLDTLKKKHHLFYENVNENIGNITLYKRKKYKQSLKIFKQISRVRRKYDKHDIAIQSDIAVLFSKINLNQNVSEEIQQLEKYYDKKDTKEKIMDPVYNNFIKLKLYYLHKAKKYKQYYSNSVEYYNYLNEKYKFEHQLNQHAISEYDKVQETSYKKEIALNKEIIKEKEALLNKRKWLSITVITILSLFIILLILINSYIKSKNKQVLQENIISNLKLKNIKLERKRLNSRLKRKRKDISNMVAFSAVKIKYLKSILNKLQKISNDNKIKKTLLPIILDLKSQINIEERFVALHSNLKDVNSDFETKLIRQYPKLSKTEREICTFIKLNFSTKEIAQIRNTSIDSVKMALSRIRKKFELKSNEKLESFIHSL